MENFGQISGRWPSRGGATGTMMNGGIESRTEVRVGEKLNIEK